jgi:hypothetical protein
MDVTPEETVVDFAPSTRSTRTRNRSRWRFRVVSGSRTMERLI